MGFKNDLAIGKKGEKLVKQVLTRYGVEVEFSEEREVDLVGKSGKKKFSIEIKRDNYAAKSGNIAIEYHNSKLDKPSGISSTPANLWVQVIPDNDYPTMWMTSVKKLKAYIKGHKPHKSIIAGGDDNANLHLYRLDDILDSIFSRIDNITSEEFKKILKELL